MSHKQARRRKTAGKPKRIVLNVPAHLVQRTVIVAVIAVVIAGGAWAAREGLDVPIAAMTVDGPFQRVSAMDVRGAVAEQIPLGFVGASLKRMQQRIEALAWVDTASVRRVWPDRIHIVVTEQVPAARWGERGLLNVRGELFIDSARHEYAELPRLSGPDAKVQSVAAQYLALRGPLIEAGLGLRAVTLDKRGAWQFVLGNGIEVRLGRREARERASRFVDVASPVVARHAEKIRYVDMRYSNGFAVGWKRPEFREQVRLEAAAAVSTTMEIQ
ncbi:MAG: cell division protein FtsQ/DivIB [Pseudomonadota bacterium]